MFSASSSGQSSTDQRIHLQDYFVISPPKRNDNKKIQLPTGEFGSPELFNGFQPPADETTDHVIERILAQIKLIASEAVNHHCNTHLNEDGSIKTGHENNVTRILTNEYFFYTKKPFTITEFEQLQNALFAYAKSLPNNLHLVIGSFAVRTPNNKVMNVVAHLECGAEPILNLAVKNARSQIDPVYSPLPNVSNKFDDISHLGIWIDKTFIPFSYHSIYTCKTAGGQLFYSCVEICVDHAEGIAKTNYRQQLIRDLFSVSKSVVIPIHVSHLLQANSKIAQVENIIVPLKHVDTLETYKLSSESVTMVNSIDPIHFGTPAHLFRTNVTLCDLIPEEDLAVVRHHQSLMKELQIPSIASNPTETIETIIDAFNDISNLDTIPTTAQRETVTSAWRSHLTRLLIQSFDDVNEALIWLLNKEFDNDENFDDIVFALLEHTPSWQKLESTIQLCFEQRKERVLRALKESSDDELYTSKKSFTILTAAKGKTQLWMQRRDEFLQHLLTLWREEKEKVKSLIQQNYYDLYTRISNNADLQFQLENSRNKIFQDCLNRLYRFQKQTCKKLSEFYDQYQRNHNIELLSFTINHKNITELEAILKITSSDLLDYIKQHPGRNLPLLMILCDASDAGKRNRAAIENIIVQQSNPYQIRLDIVNLITQRQRPNPNAHTIFGLILNHAPASITWLIQLLLYDVSKDILISLCQLLLTPTGSYPTGLDALIQKLSNENICDIFKIIQEAHECLEPDEISEVNASVKKFKWKNLFDPELVRHFQRTGFFDYREEKSTIHAMFMAIFDSPPRLSTSYSAESLETHEPLMGYCPAGSSQ